MIKLEGLIYGKRITIELEHAPHVCIVVQDRLKNIFDLTNRRGCPKKCPYTDPYTDICEAMDI